MQQEAEAGCRVARRGTRGVCVWRDRGPDRDPGGVELGKKGLMVQYTPNDLVLISKNAFGHGEDDHHERREQSEQTETEGIYA